MTVGYLDLIENDRLVDIKYETDPPIETISPRITYDDAGVPHVYCMKKVVSLAQFIERFAKGEKGMWLAAYRPSNGRQTTITFAKRDRITFGQRFLDVIEIERARQLMGPIPIKKLGEFGKSETLSRQGENEISLEELERKLALQREIGRQGEDAAYRYEHIRLLGLGCINPADHIEQVSEKNVGAGYDLRSTFGGEVRYIEVKSSTVQHVTFFISENERETLAAIGREAFIYLCHVDSDDPKNSSVVREICDPMNTETKIVLEPVAYRATLSD